MIRILLTGKTGQIGYELERSLQGLGEVFALDRAGMDLADLDQVRVVMRRIRPNLIVNAAAYTDVDRAENEPQLALRINAEAPAVMAEEARRLGAAMIHYSTDYVFDGAKPTPYTEDDIPAPLNAYGSSKLAGEQAIRNAGIAHLILRTSWIYGMRGSNFLLTVLRLARERDALRIVADQHGAPTWCRTVAAVSAHIVAQSRAAVDTKEWWQRRSGVYHLTARGQTTWHGFAKNILALRTEGIQPPVMPIRTEQYPVPARRPVNSRLSCQRLMDAFFLDLPGWQQALRLCLQEPSH